MSNRAHWCAARTTPVTRSEVDAPGELTRGVIRIDLPLPFELEQINLYLIPIDRGYLLIDCGMDTPESFAALESALGRAGARWSEIRVVVVTHMHPDHIGLAPRIRALSGASFLMHQAEAAHLDSLEREERRLPYLHDAYTRCGVPAEAQLEMDRSFAFIRKSLHEIVPDMLLRGGERIDSAIGPLTVVPTPGHSPGHICLHAAGRGLLFSGDHILNSITPNISWHPGTDALGDYLESLDRVGRLEIERVLPAHGPPFSGHREWIAETVAHHDRRCGRILEAVRDGARTAHEIAGRLWTQRLDPIHRHFAVFETMAHLEHMRRRGQLRALDRGGVSEWVAT